jgi:predicted negative regulator of RcsB-dependent stress response
MMDEFLSEQEQWDVVKRWLRENTLWVLAGIGVAAAGLGGYQWWQARVERRLQAGSAVYEQLFTAYSADRVDEVKKLAAQLASEHAGTAYAEQAQLILAAQHMAHNEQQQALELLQKVLATTRDVALAPIVRLRVARVQIDQGKFDAALATLAAAPPGAFAGRFAEVRGDALLAKGDRSGALAAYRTAEAGGATVDREALALKINALGRS